MYGMLREIMLTDYDQNNSNEWTSTFCPSLDEAKRQRDDVDPKVSR